MTRIHNAALAAIASLCLAFPAIAQDEETFVLRIHYADLDLSSPDGQAKLHRRFQRAISVACSVDGIELSKTIAAERCRRDLQRKGETQIAQLVTPSGQELAMAQHR